jgi:hypothetical protein
MKNLFSSTLSSSRVVVVLLALLLALLACPGRAVDAGLEGEYGTTFNLTRQPDGSCLFLFSSSLPSNEKHHFCGKRERAKRNISVISHYLATHFSNF